MDPATSRILITGASRGIGLAIAHRFAALGASTVLLSHTTPAPTATLATRSATQTHTALLGDVADADLWDAIRRAHPDIDILVNAAGVMQAALLLATPPAAADRVLRTNLLGPVLACRAVARGMVRRRAGCIVNIASVLGLDRPAAGSAVYGASKAGVVGLTRALAAELGGKGVRVNAVVPGYVETDMTRAMSPEARERALKATPLGRFGTAADVAEAVEYLVRSGFANGTELRIDGGLSFGGQ
ncbi:hypothetical protein EDC01DRAFT_54547 [Geopyxis carbonaria]|nr:hypothetical protein EDC01DRAFT_54547 [Geopyxis carbonaria]